MLATEDCPHCCAYRHSCWYVGSRRDERVSPIQEGGIEDAEDLIVELVGRLDAV